MDRNLNSYLVSQQENAETDVKPHIPTELIYDILSLLPVKSLLRFKCVSQSFCSLIDSPKFVNMQLNTSSMKKIHRKLIFTESTSWRPYKTRAFYVCHIDGGLEDKAVFQNQQRRKLLLCNSVNGLVLLFDEFSNLVLWNPSTGQYRNLPIPYDDHSRFRTGLGYDSASDDYKVLLIHQGSPWIFELRSNKWRRIDHKFSSYMELFWSVHAFFAHGSLHWMYKSPNTSSQTIVVFDVAKEKFSEEICPIAGYYMTGLHVLDGCLCISFFSSTGMKGARLYVRKKDGDDYKWCKLYSITSRVPKFLSIESFKNVKVVGYLKGGNRILLDLRLEYMVSYDLEKKSFKKIGFIDFVDSYASVELTAMLDESLVSVGVEEEDENGAILSG